MEKDQKYTVLVVEDEIPLQNAIRDKLETNNFLVLTARSVEQAEKHLQDVDSIDVIWLDHYLIGGETGLDFLVKLKNNKNWKKIPVFVVSNTATTTKVASYLTLGADKYYTKSDYQLEQIISDIEVIMKSEKENEK